MLARLSHRSPEAQAVAKAGAIIGRCFIPRGPRRDHGRAPGGDRGAAPGAHRQLRARRRPVPETSTTSATSSCATRSIAACRVGDRRRFHARAAEFGPSSRGSRRSIRRCTTSGRACGRRLRGGARRARGKRRASRPTAKRSTCTAGPSSTCRPTSGPAIRRRSWRRTATQPRRSRRTTGGSRCRRRRRAAAYRAGRRCPRASCAMTGIVNAEAPRRPARLRAAAPSDRAVGRSSDLRRRTRDARGRADVRRTCARLTSMPMPGFDAALVVARDRAASMPRRRRRRLGDVSSTGRPWSTSSRAMSSGGRAMACDAAHEAERPGTR